MANEIIYVCKSINNKNIRSGELKILKKYEENLYFEFGSDEVNVKKRCYKDKETLNKDFNALLELKKNAINVENIEEKDINLIPETEPTDNEEIINEIEEVSKFTIKPNRKKRGKML